MHLTSGELIRLITSDAYWKLFKPYFLGSKDIIKNKLDEIGAIRNALAHFRPIKDDDIDLVKQNAKHVLSAVEEYMSAMLGYTNAVPTNTEAQWYKVLRPLGTDHCVLSFHQSLNEQWVRVTIEYNCPIITKSQYTPDYISYNVLTLISPAILDECPSLRNLVICLSESVPYTVMGNDFTPDFRKKLLFLFSKDTIETHFNEIKKSIEEILLTISRETELIQQDNLAQGKLVRNVRSVAFLEKAPDGGTHWKIRRDNLSSTQEENHPPEFWGDFLSGITINFIAATNKYPWMPVAISKAASPF